MGSSSDIPDEWREKKERRNPDGSLNLIDARALEVGDLAHQLVGGYYSYLAAITVASDPRAARLAPETKPGRLVPEGVVRGKNGSEGTFHFEYYLNAVRTDPFVQDQFAKVYLVGAIVTVGDALARHAYFNHQPELELLYHVRNGVAHGNRFNIHGHGLKRLAKFPAHDKVAIGRVGGSPVQEISPALDGSAVLFEYLQAGDVVNLLNSVGFYCRELAYGTVGYRDS